MNNEGRRRYWRAAHAASCSHPVDWMGQGPAGGWVCRSVGKLPQNVRAKEAGLGVWGGLSHCHFPTVPHFTNLTFKNDDSSEIPCIATDLNGCEDDSWDHLNRAIMQNEVVVLPICCVAKQWKSAKALRSWDTYVHKTNRLAGACAIPCRLHTRPFAKLTASARAELRYSPCSFGERYRAVV